MSFISANHVEDIPQNWNHDKNSPLVHSKRHGYPPACLPALGYWPIHAISVGRGANARATFSELFARK